VWKKDEVKPLGTPEISTGPSASGAPIQSGQSIPLSPRAAACISQGIKIKGEVVGKEDLFIDGQVDGRLDLGSGSVTVGPNAKIKADISAREVVIRGRVDGKVSGKERVQLWSTAHVEGEVQTDRLAIEDGALFRGKVEAGKPATKNREAHTVSAASATIPLTSGTATV
jgi:cytoskeletal protein CcmA (bactofilin family)